MLIVRATRKLLDRVGGPTLAGGDFSTTVLGQWYATVLFWRPQLVLLVNAATLVPVLMPFAPTGTVCARVGDEIAAVLAAHHVPAPVVADERHRMLEVRLGRTADRRVVAAMTRFTRLARLARTQDPGLGPLDLARWLATRPCGLLVQRHVRPDRELAAFLGDTPN